MPVYRQMSPNNQQLLLIIKFPSHTFVRCSYSLTMGLLFECSKSPQPILSWFGSFSFYTFLLSKSLMEK